MTHVAVRVRPRDRVVPQRRSSPATRPARASTPTCSRSSSSRSGAAAALGVVVWPMVEFEADDALATAAVRWRDAPGVEQVVICSPDKDLSQCVVGRRVVCRDRLRAAPTATRPAWSRSFGVPPASIPDWLALVGDTADGIPGIPGWGEKSAGGGARALRDARGDPRRRRALGRRGARPRSPGRVAARAPRRRRALPPARDAAHRRPARGEPRRPRVAGRAARRPRAAVPRRSAPRTCSRACRAGATAEGAAGTRAQCRREAA